GATGDLSERKLLPALYQRQRAGQFSDPTRIIGGSRTELSDDQFREMAGNAITTHVPENDLNDTELDRFLARLYYVPVDARSGKGFEELKSRLGDNENVRALYLAVAPSIFGDFVDQIERHQLATPTSRIIVEKPIGRSLRTAKEVNEIVGRVFEER